MAKTKVPTSELNQLSKKILFWDRKLLNLLEQVELGLLSPKTVGSLWRKHDLVRKNKMANYRKPLNIIFSSARAVKYYEANELIVREGDQEDKLAIVVKGNVEVFKYSSRGKEILDRLGPGEIFGEMSFLGGMRRTAFVRALNNCQIFYLTADKIKNQQLITYLSFLLSAREKFLADLVGKLQAAIKAEEQKEKQLLSKKFNRHPLMTFGASDWRQDFNLLSERLPLKASDQKLFRQIKDVGRQQNDFRESYRLGRIVLARLAELDRLGRELSDEKISRRLDFWLGFFYQELGYFYPALTHYLRAGAGEKNWLKLKPEIFKRGFSAPAITANRWQTEIIYQNRRALLLIGEKIKFSRPEKREIAEMILTQHPGFHLTGVDCRLALGFLRAGGYYSEIKSVADYAREKKLNLRGVDLSLPNNFKKASSSFTINKYFEPVGVSKLVNQAVGGLNPVDKIGLNVATACALEPLSDKIGCTTRYQDISKNQILEHYVAAGVSISQTLRELAERIKKNNFKQPAVVYDLCFKAQLLSKKNRRGGRINHGIIEFLFPLVLAQAIYDPDCSRGIDYLFSKVPQVLKKTTPGDVEQLTSMKRLAYLESRIDRPVPHYTGVKNIYTYYQKEYQHELGSMNLNGIIHNKQFVKNYEDIRYMYSLIKFNDDRQTFNQKIVAAYLTMFKKYGYKEVGRGLVADFVAVIIYLLLCYHPEQEFIY